jgi:hypothetical protein
MMARVVMVVDTGVDVRGNFIRQSAQNARRNVKFLSNQAETVRFTARIAFPKGRLKAANVMLYAVSH